MAPRKKASAKARPRKRSKKTKGKGRKAIAKRSSMPKPPSQRSILRALMKGIAQSTEDTTVDMESTMLCDPNMPLERPTKSDVDILGAFAGPGYIQMYSDMVVSSVENEPAGLGEDSRALGGTRLKALPPAIPEWDDDTPESAAVTYFAGVRRIKNIDQRRKQEKKSEAPTFQSLSPEIRDIIYRDLLLAESPIQVHGGWKLVYKGAKRNRLALHTSILRVSKATFAQASRILYGENTFLYLLRDLPNSVTDTRGLVEDDARSSAGDEGNSDSEYDSSSSRVARRRVPQRRSRAQKSDINFNKYSWLMRRLAVEAEHNRYSQATQDSMAKAIRLFAYKPPPGRRTFSRQRNIHTLTVRVAPQRIATPPSPAGVESFTFVDFFEPGSKVLRAIKSIECQYLQVDLLRGTASRLGGSRAVEKETGCRLVVDMRYQRLEKVSLGNTPRDDLWIKDRLATYRRRQKTDQSMRAVNQLAATIRQHCSQWTFDNHQIGESDLEISDGDVDE